MEYQEINNTLLAQPTLLVSAEKGSLEKIASEALQNALECADGGAMVEPEVYRELSPVLIALGDLKEVLFDITSFALASIDVLAQVYFPFLKRPKFSS